MKGLKQRIKPLMLGITLGAAQFLPVIYPVTLHAEVSTHEMVEFTNYPIMASEGSVASQPMVIINTSNDHQLYYKAYNDFTDLDPGEGDGIETTYKHAIDYYGYFDSYKCYTYNSGYTVTGLVGGGRFEPSVDVDAAKYCSGATWSGNFLNWASMSRIDAIRKILFGGHRRVDAVDDTVLERTYLPNDAHSWAKYYDGTDIDKLTPFSVSEITLCNTTLDTAATKRISEEVDSPPLIRVAEGNYALWASNERWQCLWREELNTTFTSGGGSRGKNANVPASGMDAQSDSPVKVDVGLGSDDYTARVQACVGGKIGEESCRLYDSGHYKPRGLLQIFGEDDRIHFGMFGGSFLKNKSGGILIKDIGSFTDEIDETNGRFIKVYEGAQVGGLSKASDAEGIVNTWSLWRIIGYRHADGTYGVSGLNSNNCEWGSSAFTNGQCMNWGNPFAEIYFNALRYLAGESVSGTFRSNALPVIEGLNTPNVWNCPLDDTNFCSSLNVINFNSSVISYDADDLDGVGDSISSMDAPNGSAGLTDTVGDGEGITNKDYFVGEIGGAADQLCSSKDITGLGSVLGLCPEAPRLEGSYRLAGLAHWAHTNDIRSEGNTALPEEQLVDTYSVALASSLPQIEIPVPDGDKRVRILPSCRSINHTSGDIIGNCAIVDFKIVTPHAEASPGVWTGKYYVNWEDTEQGGDYDQDMWGTIEYSITSTKIKVTTDVHTKSTPFKMGFGYVINGTTQDGFHVHSGINEFTFVDDIVGVPGCTAPVCDDGDSTNPLPATSYTYTIGGSAADLLEDPLYYAAKWGGFTDQNDNDIPDLQAEWDNRDENWIKGQQDGIPDNYFFATNPATLEAALIRVFNDILSKTASGTAAAVVANSRQGNGAIYQALYQTNKIDQDGLSASWFGTLQAFWIDQFGLMRVDGTPQNAKLDDYDTDKVVEVYFDKVENKPRYCLYDTESLDPSVFEPDPNLQSTADGQCHTGNGGDLLEVPSLWNARERLSALPADQITAQRGYGTAANSRRHILTWIDADLDGTADEGVVDFVAGANFRFFDVADQAAADGLINYIRGEEQVGSRSRTLDLDEDGDTEVLRLGDIVNSTPTVVGAPAEAFDLLYKDSSYLTFRQKYHNRRQVVYVGANDGLLHAFNGGFFVEENGVFKFLESPLDENGAAIATKHPLGAELWAYAPMNLLPHLKWLKDPDYTHVFYMDAKPRVFDAKIFADDTVHPGGWGTVLVAGMRLGGGGMTIDLAGDDLGPPNAADDTEMTSAYVVLDITNPEEPPELLAEIKAPGLGFTTSYPTAFTVNDAANNINNWYLVFGSGPTVDKINVESKQPAGLFIYDLVAKDFVTDYGPKALPEADSFVGDPVSVDWNLSYKADSLYFGVIGGDAAAPTGKLYKMRINRKSDPTQWVEPALFFDAVRPIVPTPTVSWDGDFNHWIHFGTGRMFAFDDTKSTGQQAIYGIRDLEDDVEVLDTVLVDVTNVKVFTDGELAGIDLPNEIDGGGTPTFYDLEYYINAFDAAGDGVDHKGWYKGLPFDAAFTEPSTRAFNTSALLGQILFTTTFTPGTNQCDFQGESDLYGLYFKTGTAFPGPVTFGVDETDKNLNQAPRVLDSLDMGSGIASSPSLHTGDGGDDGTGDGDNKVTVITQTGVGAIKKDDASTVSKVRSGEVSWREEVDF